MTVEVRCSGRSARIGMAGGVDRRWRLSALGVVVALALTLWFRLHGPASRGALVAIIHTQAINTFLDQVSRISRQG